MVWAINCSRMVAVMKSFHFVLLVIIFNTTTVFAKSLVSMYRVPFDHQGCQMAYGSKATIICPVMKAQYSSVYFRRDLVYISQIGLCDGVTGNQTSNRNHPNAVFCVIYVTDNEIKRTVIIRTQFGNSPRYPLMFQGLMVNIKVMSNEQLSKILL